MDRFSKPRAALIILITLLAACGTTSELEVTGVTANLALPSDTGAIYMSITNNTDRDDRLIAAGVPGCGAMEFHEMMMEGDVMMMHEVEGGEIVIPAGETVVLEQGGLHVMCIGKTGDFAVGDSVPVILEFAVTGTIEVLAEVVGPGK